MIIYHRANASEFVMHTLHAVTESVSFEQLLLRMTTSHHNLAKLSLNLDQIPVLLSRKVQLTLGVFLINWYNYSQGVIITDLEQYGVNEFILLLYLHFFNSSSAAAAQKNQPLPRRYRSKGYV